MGFFDRFSGPPTEDKFARLVRKMLKQVGDRRDSTFDKAQFQLDFTKDGKSVGTINLRNLYLEYCRLDHKERSTFLHRSCVALGRHIDVPDDFEDVKPDLFPTVRPRAMIDILRITAELDGGGSAGKEMAVLPLSDHLVVCLVYDMPNSIHFVTQGTLDKWGISLYEAAEVARQNLAEKEFKVGTIGEKKLFIFLSSDAYDASRMLMPDRIRSFGISGTPVAMPISRDMLIVTGSVNTEELGMMADMAEEQKAAPRVVCSIAHCLVDDQWEPWLPPPDHPHAEKFRILKLRQLHGDYAEQKALLDKRHIQTGLDVFVAAYTPVGRGGKPHTWCVWSKTVPSYLPEAEFVGLHDPLSKQTGFVTWERLRATAGHLMTPLDCYPPRWSVEEFPTPDEIERMKPEDWSKG